MNLALAFELTFVLSALLLGSYLVFDERSEANGSLESVKWIYIALSCTAILLALACRFVHFPEITDKDMNDEAQRTAEQTGWTDRPLRKQYMLFLGVAATACYTGAQSSISAFFINFLRDIEPSLSNADAAIRMAIGFAVFTVGRFSFAFLMKVVKPRRILLIAMTATVILIGALIKVRGTPGVALLILAWLSKSPIYPTIYTTSLRGLGRHTTTGGAMLISAICGGAIFAPAHGALADRKGTQLAMVVPLTGLVLAWGFAIYVNVFKSKVLDGYRDGDGKRRGSASRSVPDSSCSTVAKEWDACEEEGRVEMSLKRHAHRNWEGN